MQSFEPQIEGVGNLIRLADAASRRQDGSLTRLFFTSSVGVANNSHTDQIIPETPLRDFASSQSGYGLSKLISERLLLEAAERFRVLVTICRVGQIAGPVKVQHAGGAWNRQEWLPSVSTYTGVFPSGFFFSHLHCWPSNGPKLTSDTR